MATAASRSSPDPWVPNPAATHSPASTCGRHDPFKPPHPPFPTPRVRLGRSLPNGRSIRLLQDDERALTAYERGAGNTAEVCYPLSHAPQILVIGSMPDTARNSKPIICCRFL
jgi:hypothetical protein